MKNLKFGVLGLGVIGLLGLLIMGGLMESLKHDAANTIMVLAGFIAPIVMGALALKAPFQRWQGGVAAAGFALVAVKFRAWQLIKIMGHLPTGMKMAVIACLVGVVVSVITIAVPEES